MISINVCLIFLNLMINVSIFGNLISFFFIDVLSFFYYVFVLYFDYFLNNIFVCLFIKMEKKICFEMLVVLIYVLIYI